ncbi:tyrosine-protein kinase Etk/Wzc [Dysgonomonadaceae bacterium PH5-43]|nr:tyrosine-protein kinase Etk/Wzc [Dysgonomonadaceae bacterium PH5-43]
MAIKNKTEKNTEEQSIEQLFNQTSSNSFDIVTLIISIAKYWYWFVIAGFIALGLAYVKNKSWTPTYITTTTVLIETSKNGLGTNFANNSMVSANNKTFNNQMLMYQSYDFISRVVDSMKITNEIYIKHKFKNTVLYKNAPVAINTDYIASNAYGLEFKIKGIDEENYEVSFMGNDYIQPFALNGKYDEEIQHALFYATISKTNFFVYPTYEYHFRFISKNQLVNLYRGSMSSKIIMEGASVIEIAVVGKVAERDLDFLNILNNKFFEENLERKNTTAEQSIDFLAEQISIMQDSIDSSGSALNSFQASTGLYSTQDESTSKNKSLQDLANQISQLELRRKHLSSLSKSLDTSDGEITADPTAFNVSSPPLVAFITEYNMLVREMNLLGESNPRYSKNKTRIAEVKGNIKNLLRTLESTIDLEAKDVNGRYNKVYAELKNRPKQERELMTREKKYQINETYHNYLLQKRTESQIQKASNTADNLVIDNPRLIGVTNAGDRQSVYVFYLLIGFLIPLVYIICKELLFKYSVQSREEVEKITQLPIIGTIEKSKKKEEIVVKHFPRSSFTEGFRNLRSRMEYIAQKEKPISMLLTSTEPQDGKTFIALNMASIYEISNARTVVVDFDLRRPALSRSLGVDKNKGVSNYLIGQVDLDDIIVHSEEYNFDILPAGVIPPNPSELVRTDKTKELINTLLERYDYVILDCSPVGLVSDAHYLAKLVDVLLFVVRNQKTNRNFLKYTIKELKEDNVENIAVVYNDVNIKDGYYGMKRYYGKSSYYLKHNSYYHEE